MKNQPDPIVESWRVAGPIGSNNGAFVCWFEGAPLRVVVSNGLGWDHVSVSLENRCPTWEEMCYIRSLFFLSTETVVQYHPAAKDYVNDCEFCLHLWRPQNAEIPTPDKEMVGRFDGMTDEQRRRAEAKSKMLAIRWPD